MDHTRQQVLSTLNPRHLNLILYPTEQCNFRCTYCYEDFEMGRMNNEVQQGVKNLIKMRASNLDSLHLSWFGGEPLAAKDIVLSISDFAKKICQASEIKLSGGFTTNGYLLTPELVQDFADLNQNSYQISLDGYREGHDKTRKLISGKGTFDTIWHNLLQLSHTDIDFKILLRIHLTRSNIDSIISLAKEIKSQFLSDKRFSVYLKPIENLGGSLEAAQEVIPHHERASVLKEINTFLFDNSNEKSESHSGNYICYASRPNSLAIRANGLIQKCTVMLSDDNNTVGKINSDGTIALSNDKMQLWMRGYREGADLMDLECPAHTLPKTSKTIPIIAI